MEDYKGLIDSLRICVKYKKAAEALCNAEYAADAIEQLVKERDAAIADLKELSDKVQSCKYCKNLKDDICTYYATHPKEKANCGDGKFFEWRGLQEVEHETD